MSLPTVHTPLVTSGRYIIDSLGNRVKLAGVNWAGAHQDVMVPAGLDYLSVSSIASQIASWGFNAVRFPFAQNTVLSTAPVPNAAVAANTGFYGMTPWQVYKQCVTALTSAGIMVIPNCHLNYQGWCCSTSDTNGLWWNTNWSYSTFLSTWQTVATALAANALVVAYDIKNEPRSAVIGGKTFTPTWGTGNQQTDFQWMYTQVGNAILAIDSNALLICEGLNYAQDLTGVKQHPVVLNTANRVIYSMHDYPWFHATTQTQQQYVTQMYNNGAYIMQPNQAYTAPVWIGEFGISNDSEAILGLIPPGSSTEFNKQYWQWWSNFRYWAGQALDVDQCFWHISGTHVKGTEPGTNQLVYQYGDRTWNGLYSQSWNGASSPSLVAQLQALQVPLVGPGTPYT